MALLSVLLYILFVLAAIVLVVVILLQEGKGGGLTGALGTEGQQTFGVGAKGINQFTGWTCAIFLIAALGIHFVNRQDMGKSVVEPESVLQNDGAPPADGTQNPGGGTTPPAATGGQTPPDNGGTTPPPGDKPK